MNKEQVRQYIDENIYDNTTGAITGSVLNDVMKQVVDSGMDDAPSDGKTYGRKDGAWAEVESGSADAVLYTPQELTEEQQTQVQTNIAIKNLVDFAGVGAKRNESFVVWKNAFRGTTGEVVDNNNYRISQPVKVKFGDIIEFNMGGGVGTSVLLEVLNDDSHTFVRSIFAGGNNTYRYIADKDMYVEFSGAYQSFDNTYSIQSADIANNLPAYKTPDGGYLRSAIEAIGIEFTDPRTGHKYGKPKFNEQTGFYELNGFNDITVEEMETIYNEGVIDSPYIYGKFYDKKALRTNIFNCKISGGGGADIGYYCDLAFTSSNIEVLCLSTRFRLSSITLTHAMTFNAGNMHTILGVIDFFLDTKDYNNSTYPMFGPKLIDATIYNINGSFYFGNCRQLSYYTVNTAVVKSSAKKAVTWTMHPNIYALLSGTATDEEYTATGHTKEEWMQIVTDAISKNISFATTE